MNGLALLCNLHADGATTLERLRARGCGTIDALGTLASDELADCLGQDGRGATRFLADASRLGQRLTGEAPLWSERVLAAEEAAVRSRDAPVAAAELPPRESAAPAPASTAPPTVDPQLPEAPVGNSIVDAVLDTWRDLDEHSPAPAPRTPAPSPRVTACDVLPAREPRPSLALVGIPPKDHARWAAIGVDTLDELAHADALVVARALAVPFTRVRHLQFLARRLRG